MKKIFNKYDWDNSYELEIQEARNMFDELKVHFETMQEMSGYFHDRMMGFEDVCDLLEEKMLATHEDVLKAKVSMHCFLSMKVEPHAVSLQSDYLRGLFLEPSDLVDRDTFRIKRRAIVWIRKVML